MTEYGFYDNDIMDEVMASDIIHATGMGGFQTEYNRPWYEDWHSGPYGLNKYDDEFPSVFDKDYY